MLEKDIEKHFVKQVKLAGGKAYKWTSPGNVGVPDRIVLFPPGQIFFVELKATGKKPTDLQLAKHAELKKLGHTVFIIDSKEKVDAFIVHVTGGDK